MPWDASLNKDVDDSFQFHVALTKNLLPTDPLKFSASTTQRLDHGYLRLLGPENGPAGGSPTSTRIIQDITKCMGAHLLEIIKARGAIVPGLVSRSGHRSVPCVERRGGTRVKNELKASAWVHDDAKAAREKLLLPL